MNWINLISLALLVAAITFSPDFSLGTISGNRQVVIRIEDIAIVIFGLAWIANILVSKRTTLAKPPLLLPIVAWLGFGALGVLTNLMLWNIEISRGFFYFLKEIEFFLFYFYVWYQMRDIYSVKFILNFWIILGVGAITLIFIQLAGIIPRYGTYGPSLYRELGPFPSGGFFLILFINLFSIFLYYHILLPISRKKKIFFALAILPLTIGVITSGSRTAIMGLTLALFLSLLLYQVKRGGIKTMFINVLFLALLGGISYILIFVITSSVRDLGHFSQFDINTLEGSRVFVWREQINAFSEYNYLYFLSGLGKSVRLTAEESHSQYVRNLIETGVIGSILFFILLFAIIREAGKSFIEGKNPLVVGLAGGTLVSTLVMLIVSVAVEAFLVVRVAEIYWFFVALSMAGLYHQKKLLQKSSL